MSDFAAGFFIALGVLIAVIYPIIWGFIRKEFQPQAAPGLPDWVVKYGILLVFCMVTAVVLLVVYRNVNPNTTFTWYGAMSLGFGYESTIEKLWGGAKRPAPP